MGVKPIVSVVMSVWNGEKYIRESIESILDQTFSDFEFIIINDGSTDHTPKILAEYEQKDNRVRVFNQSNQGLTVSLNNAIQHAKGKYIARMDSGDISMPTRVEKQLKYLTQNEQTGIVGSHFSYIDDNGKITETVNRPIESGFLKWLLLFYNPIPNSLAMYRLNLAREIGGYNLHYSYSQDYDFLCSISERSNITIVPEVLFLVRLTQSEDISSKHSSKQKELSIQTSQIMMAKLIKSRPPWEIVRNLKYEIIPSIEEAGKCSKLIIALYQSFLTQNILEHKEKAMIKKDSARRLWNISRPNLKYFSMWLVLLYSCYLDSYYAKSLLVAPIRWGKLKLT